MTPDRNTLGYRRGARAAWVGIAGNVGLGIAKAVGGVVGGSAALVTDAAHSLSDSVSSVAVLIGMRVAALPPDEKHPYGHDRAEAIAGKTVSTMLVIFSLYMIYRSVAGIWTERHADTSRMGLALLVGLLSILVKELMFQYKRRVGEQIGSSALIADAWHHRSDALSSVVAVLGIGFVLWGGPRWAFMDHLAAIGVGLMIFWVGVAMFRRSLSELMDTMAPPDTVRQIVDAAMSVDGVQGVETVNARKSGLSYLVDLHVEVDPGLTVERGHRIASAARDKILQDVPTVRRVLVHVEPYYPGDH